jgi:hypothetical protein
MEKDLEGYSYSGTTMYFSAPRRDFENIKFSMSGVTVASYKSGVSEMTVMMGYNNFREWEPTVIYRDRYIERPARTETVVVEKPVERIVYKEAYMWTWTNIGIVILIVIFTMKVIMPRLNWRWAIRKFVSLFWKPAKKEATTIKAEWEEANK